MVYRLHMNDYDPSTAYVHAKEIVESGSLFPEFYSGTTSMEIDSTVALTAVFYKIIGNIFLAQGLSNIFLILIYIVTLLAIFRLLGFDSKTKYAMLILYFIPYTVGMLDYAPMQFISASLNAVRNYIPLLYLLCLIEHNNGIRNVRHVIKCVIVLALMLLTSISAGFYVLAFGILGLIVADVLYIVLNDDIRLLSKTAWLMHILMIIACGFGMLIQKRMGFESKAASQLLVTAGNTVSNTQKWFIGIFELFGGVAEADTEIVSISGIAILFKFIISCFVIFSIIFYTYKWIKDKQIDRVIMYILCVCALDAVALNLLYVTYGSTTYEFRYHIMPMLLALILTGYLFEQIWKISNQLLRICLTIGGCILLLGAALLSDKQLNQRIVEYNTVEGLKAINSSIEDHDVKTAIVYTENIREGRKLRNYGEKVNYIVVNTEMNTAPTLWGGTSRYLDAADQSGKVAMVMEPPFYELLDAKYKADLTLVDNIMGFDIYVADHSIFDFQSGLVKGKDVLIDYPYTTGYASDNGTIGDDGILTTDGSAGVALYGPYYQGVDGVWNYTLEYDIVSNDSAADAVFEIWQSGTPISSCTLNSDSKTVCIENVNVSSDMASMEHRVNVPEGMVIKIKSIKMEKVSE